MIGDTIWTQSSAHGPGARAILRVSGPRALPVTGALLGTPLARERAALDLAVPCAGSAVEALVLVMPAPRSYTGEDLVELHVPGSPLLVSLLGERLQALGARAALPGELTRRACENGRMSLAAAEGLAALLAAQTEEELRFARHALDGGLAAACERVRGSLEDALATLESGLDFTEGETGEVAAEQWCAPLRLARERLLDVLASAPPAAAGGGLLLVGPANAGKSALCNALAGTERALVSARPGTTRDVLRFDVAGAVLYDAPGDLEAPQGVDARALAARATAVQAQGALLVVDCSAPRVVASPLPVVAVVLTKCDLVLEPPRIPGLPDVPVLTTSAVTGAGLAGLRELVVRKGRGRVDAGTVLLAGHARQALELVEHALAVGESGTAPELAAVEIGGALRELEVLAGRSSPEDLLDRVFATFCLGK